MTLKIAVCMKIVPDPGFYRSIRIDPKTHTMIRKGIPTVINTDDLHALEAALQLKDSDQDVEITLISMGPKDNQKKLIEALGYGGDRAVLLSDRKFGGADSLATSYTLAKGIEKTGPYDLILAGSVSDDGATAHVPSQLGELLHLPHVTNAESLALTDHKTCLVRKNTGESILTCELPLPCLIGTARKLNKVRYPNVRDIFAAGTKLFETLTAADFPDIDAAKIGLSGSPSKAVGFIEQISARTSADLPGKDLNEKAAELIRLVHAGKGQE